MKKLNIKKIALTVLTALIIVGIGYYIGMNLDAISFAFTHPDKVRIAKYAWEAEMKEAEQDFAERFFISPLADEK